MDSIADQERCMALAAPLLKGIYEVLDEARKIYFGPDYSDRARAEHTQRAAANNIYAHAEKELLRRCVEWPGAQPLPVRGLNVLNYKDMLLFRLKKVDGKGRHRNYQTQQQRDYDDQKQIPGLPYPADRLTAGYQMNASGDNFERVMIARPMGRRVIWTVQVLLQEGVASWEDITPPMIPGTERVDFDAERARRRR